jgi:NAD(P)-dependent dehydrogenase (short-subunit alcohol dehydrogenase family)
MKTFLSIGTGPGMGAATAERFAREGFQVVLCARNEAKTNHLADQLRAQGHEAAARTLDASDPIRVAALVESVEGEFGGIDVLHYNAASMRAATLADQPKDSFNADLAVNIGGAMAAAQAVAPKMAERRSGTILLTGGGLALYPQPDYISLSIGKAGIRALALGLFESFKANGIHIATVTVSSPGGVSPEAARAVADKFWALHDQPTGSWETEAVYPSAD